MKLENAQFSSKIFRLSDFTQGTQVTQSSETTYSITGVFSISTASASIVAPVDVSG